MPRKKTTAAAVDTVKAAEVKANEVKADEVKTEEIKTAEKAAEPEKAPRKRSTAKSTTAKTAEVKKETTKKAASKKETVKKAELKSALYVQYSGKSYAQEDLIKIARDVWKYDLKRKVGELKSVDLYVKPEENKVYYVMNKEFTGSFDI